MKGLTQDKDILECCKELVELLKLRFAFISIFSCNGATVKRRYYNGDFIYDFDSDLFSYWPKEKSDESIGKLTTSLLHDIYSRAGKDYNIVISPVSIWTVLAMLFEGAAGKTEKELKSKLQLFYGPHDEGSQILRSRYDELRRHLPGPNSPTQFTSLNFMVNDKLKMIDPQYKDTIRQFYRGVSFQVNQRETDRVATAINNWAKAASKNRIQTIVSPGMLDNLVLLIGNAVYFKSKWKYPFDRLQTIPMAFRDENGRATKNVFMMNQLLTLPYSYNTLLESQVVEIPYSDDTTSMVIILPNGGVRLANVLYKMRSMSLDSIAPRNMTEESVQLAIPRFHVISKMYLNEFLKRDLPSAFSREYAEFPGIAKDIYVSKVSHEAEIENNEEGTTAFGITSVQFTYKISGVVFQANRPFIYLIIDTKARNILFAGTFSNPFKNLS